jgi:transformer-2 protein
MSLFTGTIRDIKIIYDAKTQSSRNFGFVYFKHMTDASDAKHACNGILFHSKNIRVDYSLTKRAHSPTPGIYMGRRNNQQRHRRYYDESR